MSGKIRRVGMVGTDWEYCALGAGIWEKIELDPTDKLKLGNGYEFEAEKTSWGTIRIGKKIL